MKVTIIGTGNMARGIGTRMLAGGHDVELVGHEPGDAEKLAPELQDAAAEGATATPAGNQLTGEVVVLAMYYPATLEALQQYRDQLAGKIIVDISNPVDFETWEPTTPPGTSAAEEVAGAAPQGARVVKAFNTTFAGTLVEGEVAGRRLDVLIAGDDAEAKATVARLAEAGGLRAIDAGPLKLARQLEALGLLHMALQNTLNTEFGSAVKFLG